MATRAAASSTRDARAHAEQRDDAERTDDDIAFDAWAEIFPERHARSVNEKARSYESRTRSVNAQVRDVRASNDRCETHAPARRARAYRSRADGRRPRRLPARDRSRSPRAGLARGCAR